MDKPGGAAFSLTAAECAARMGLSVRALRVYEARGLIRPRRTAKSWRVYGVDELTRLSEILALKRLGLNLARISDLLARKPTDLDRTLAMQEAALEALRVRAERSLVLVRAARQRIAMGQAVSIDELIEITKETEMANQSADALAWRRYEQARPRSERPIEPRLYDRYVGSYQFAEGALIVIVRRDDGLSAQLTGQDALEIYPEKEDAFFLRIVPAQITFEREGDAPAHRLILHQDGYELEAQRVDEATARSFTDELERRIRNRIPSPNSEALLRELIDEAARGAFNYDRMTEALAAATRAQCHIIQRDVEKAGRLTSVAFKGVSPDGWDVYDVGFENGAMEWRFALASDGKLSGAFIRALP